MGHRVVMAYLRRRTSAVGLFLLGCVGVLAVAELAFQGQHRTDAVVGALLVLVAATAIVLLRDVAGSLDASVASREELGVRLGQQEAIARLGQLAITEVSWQELLDETCRVVATELRTDLAGVLELLPGGEELVVRAATGWPRSAVGVSRVPAGPRSQGGYTLTSREPVILRDAAAERRFMLPPAMLEFGVTSGISTSIGSNGATYGVLGAHTLAAREFSAHDVNFLQSVAHLLAAVLRGRAAEAETEKAHQALEAVVEGTSDDVFVKDAAGRFVVVNAAAAATLGLPREQLIGRTLEEVLPADQAAAMARTDQLVLEQGTTQVFEEALEVGEVSRVYLSAKGPYRSRDGTLLGTFGIARDITQRKRVEEELRLARDYADRLIETSNAILIVLDEDANILTFNRAAEEITGYTREEVLGRNWDLLLPRDDYPEPWEAFAELVADGTPEHYENPILTKSGEERTILWRNSRLDDQHGNFLGTVSYGIDVTEAVAAKERSQQLEAQLRQAERLEAIGRLAGGVAHDFNNLLVAIRGYAELSRAQIESTDRIAGHLDEIVDAADRAASLTGQLLAFGRRQVLKPEVLDVNEVVEKLSSLLRRLLGEHVQLVTSLAEAPVLLEADRGQLEQVITNLALNGRDAMPGGGTLTISVETDGDTVLIAVSDEGVGIHPETAAHIFEPFFTTKSDLGHGLGLATVHGIVAQSGGEISLETAPGRGTTFTISFPRTTRPRAAVAQPETTRLDGNEAILLIEDDSTVRAIVSEMLAAHGYDVATAANGEEAIAHFQTTTRPIPLVVSDLIMPGLDGRETIDRIRKIAPATRVLYMSGYAADLDIHTDTTPAATNFIQKPFSGDELVTRIRQLLKAQRQTAEPVSS